MIENKKNNVISRNKNKNKNKNSRNIKNNTKNVSSKKSNNKNQETFLNENFNKLNNESSVLKEKKNNKKSLKVISLGGLEEIGKNITVYEYGEDIVVIDCGMAFPDEETPGIDVRIPDFTYLIENQHRIKGLFITHGHEDHIGGIAYLLKNINIPIYGTRLTLGILEGKLKEHNLLQSSNLNVIDETGKISLGKFSLEFIHVNHSIPGSIAIAIHTPIGTVIHTGDFKIDTTPIDGAVTNINKLCELSKKNILALAIDSTNAERTGYSVSEKDVGTTLNELFQKSAGKRILIATFASNIHRLQQIFDAAKSCGRKVAISGKSMLNNVTIAVELGYMNVSQNTLISIDDIDKYNDGQLTIITTGSQGEPMSALHKIAYGEHRQVSINHGDVVIISANPISGNEKLVNKVINELVGQGATVYHSKNCNVHVSGHACQEEIKLLINIIKPKYFIPIHGEKKHLIANANVAKSTGIEGKNIVIAKIGDVIELNKDKCGITGTVPSGQVFVDGYGVGDVGNIVLRDRRLLADDGIIIVAITIDKMSKTIICGPEITSRGFVYMRESEAMFREMKNMVVRTYRMYRDKDYLTIKTAIKDKLGNYIYNETKRNPMVLTMILDLD